jgi:hypothetical protein
MGARSCPICRVFVLAAVFASASEAFALDRVAVNVPFSFETPGEILPAGTYEVEFDWIDHTLKLSSASGPISAGAAIQTPDIFVSVLHQRCR